MKFSSLEAFGIHCLLIEAWRRELGEELLPVQEAAIRAGLLNGKSLLVVAPGSAGKTLVAEMAVAMSAMKQGKSLYLVPTRALAEEKFDVLCRRFGQLGLKVAISTRDHPEYDAAILRGEFDILLAVPEKARALCARNPAILTRLNLLVADEIQLLSDEERGPALEMLLAEARWANRDIQIVAMTAAAREKIEAARWLGAEIVQEKWRPVELRVGVLHDGLFRFREQNSGRRSEESLPWCDGGWERAAVKLSVELAARNEATIIFVRDKNRALHVASEIAASGALPPASSLCESLRSLPLTAATKILRQLAAGGVAIHHGDLGADERALVEEAFAAGDLRVVVATSTLSVGVNLPARNVIIEPIQWQPPRSRGQRAAQQALPLVDFLAMAGRAGRLGNGDQFGRAILIAQTPLQRDVLMRQYVEAQETPLEPALARLNPDDAAVVLGASLIAADAGIQEAWRRSFTALLQNAAELPPAIAKSVQKLAQAGLFDDGRPTCLLRPAAAGADAATLLWLARLREGGHTAWSWLAVMALACSSPYAARLVFPLRHEELRHRDYVAELLALAEEKGLMSEGLRILQRRKLLSLRDAQRAAKMCLAMMDRVEGADGEAMEEKFHIPAARIEAIAGAVAWLMQLAADMAEALGWPKAALHRICDAAAALRRGPGAAVAASAEYASPSLYPYAAPLQAPNGDSGETLLRVGKERAQKSPGIEEGRRIGGAASKGTKPSQTEKDPGGQSAEDGQAPIHEQDAAEQRQGSERRGLVMDMAQPDRAWFAGVMFHLTPSEFRLLWRLAKAPQKCVLANRLGNYVFGEADYIAPHQLYSHVSRIRKKIEDAAKGAVDGHRILETVPRRGWRLNIDPQDIELLGEEEEALA